MKSIKKKHWHYEVAGGLFSARIQTDSIGRSMPIMEIRKKGIGNVGNIRISNKDTPAFMLLLSKVYETKMMRKWK